MRKYILLLFILFFSMLSFAQFIDDEEPEYATNDSLSFKNRLIFGGNLGLVFGTYTYINISPTVGYKIKPDFAAGVGVIYEYVNDKTYRPYYETTIFGGKLFVQHVLFDCVILYAENNTLSLEKRYYDRIHSYPQEGRFILNVPWVGGGFYQRSGKGGMYLMILFNLNNSANSPYSSYEYRMGFNF